MKNIFHDVTDLINYLLSNNSPSGIQRVQMDIMRATVLMPSKSGVNNYYLYLMARGVKLISQKDLIEFIDMQDKRDRAAFCKEMISNALVVNSSEILRSQVKSDDKNILFISGAPWNNINYSEFLNLMKNSIHCHVVQLIHDLIPLKHPEYFEQVLVNTFENYFVNCSKYIDKLLTVSAKTGKDLKFIAKHFDAKPQTGLLGNLHKGLKGDNKSGSTDFPIDEDFVLFVSTIEKRKNHEFIARVWKKLIELNKNAPALYCVGKLGWRSDEFYKMLAGNPKLSKKIKILSDVSDEQLSSMYEQCKYTVYPALEEGFGLPVAESLSYGKLCVAGTCDSLKEASQNLAITLDEYDAEAWIEKLSELNSSPAKIKTHEQKVKKSFKSDALADYAKEILVQLDPVFNKSKPKITNYLAPSHEYVFRDPDLKNKSVDNLEVNSAYMLPITNDFGTAENYQKNAPFFTMGDWLEPESWGRWARYPGGSLNFSLEEGVSSNLYISTILRCIPPLKDKVLTIALNGFTVNAVKLSTEPKRLIIKIPPKLVQPKNNLLSFFYQDRSVNIDEIRKIDGRMLSIGIFGILMLDASDNKNIPIFMDLMSK